MFCLRKERLYPCLEACEDESPSTSAPHFRDAEQELADVKLICETFGLDDETSHLAHKTIPLAQATVQDAIIVSLLTDTDLGTAERKQQLDGIMKSVDGLEKSFGPFKAKMFPVVLSHATRLVTSKV